MKRSKTLLALCVILAGFFLFWSVAEFYYAMGKDKVPQTGLKSLQTAGKLFPFQPAYPGEAGFALMEHGTRDEDPAEVKASIPFFLVALKRNPLDYRSRYYLAKAYLQFSALNNDYFERGVSELKRAARIRGSNKQIALDCSKVFLSLWPLLEEEDRGFAGSLIANSMPALSWEDFSPLLEMWSLYVQDARLLKTILSRRPDFFGPAANQLVAAGIPLSERWKLLDLYEVYSLDAGERLYNEKLLNNEMDAEQARQLFNHLNIRGYFRLHPDSQMSVDKLHRLQRQLLLEIISGMLSDPGTEAAPKAAFQLREYIERFIAVHADLNGLDELQKLLEEKQYFKANDFPSLRLKTLISYKKGDYGGVIAEIEALRKGISFVRKEQAADYTDILLLLIDSYYSTKLLTAAEAIAAELYKEQPDNSDVLWRVLRVQKILGDEGAPDRELNEKLAVVEKSRFLTVTKPNVTYDVYLFNQPWIEITMDPALLAQLKPKQLVQVFVNNKIAFESYVDGLPAKIAIGPKFVEIESKVKVQITVI
jgi:hypothetical protein